MDIKSRVKLLLFIYQLMCCSRTATSLCEVETGEVIIILDIRESIDDKYDQLTEPSVLPITGNVSSEIRLKILLDTEKIFTLNGKQLKLIRFLDRDKHHVSFIQVQLQCTVISTLAQRTIPVTVRVIDINDNSPQFINTPYEISISEVVPVGTTIFRGLQAEDKDNSVNGLVEYFIVPRNDSKDSFSMFSIDLPHQGFVTLRRPLDYEKCRNYDVAIVAIDRASKVSERLSSTTTLTIKILDADDQGPAFDYPEYAAFATTGKMVGAVLNVSPSSIRAFDQDTFNSTVLYSFDGGIPSDFSHYFVIDNITAVVRQIKAVDKITTTKFNITIKAEEQSEQHRSANAGLNIIIGGLNESLPRPILTVNHIEGFVVENSPVGSVVHINKSGLKEDLTFNITYDDLVEEDPTPDYVFELNTDLYAVDKKYKLITAASFINRNPSNVSKHVFQVSLRGGDGFRSNSVTVTVHLIRIKVESKKIDPALTLKVAPMTEPIALTQIQVNDIATDPNDEDDLSYSLKHVSNNGSSMFRVDNMTGVVESTGPLQPGKHYSLTIEAVNRNGRTSHRILEVDVASLIHGRVLTGQFSLNRDVYDVHVNEGAPVGTIVLSLPMDSMEFNQNVSYWIVNGNIDNTFQLNAENGALSIQHVLDREKTDHYMLTMNGRETDGQIMSATINIQITDINDNNPRFIGEPYMFVVDEGRANMIIGTVKALDPDAGANGIVYYSVPSDSLFRVDPVLGEVSTRRALDFESQPIQYVIVTALDGAIDPRIATATVTVVVNDVPDEPPVFERQYYEGSVAENLANVDVLQVTAHDPDTHKQITYVIREGPSNQFAVDPITGVIRVIYPLNYEESSFYMLTIGARENFFESQNSNCIVKINVLDRNDIPPLFTSIPSPLRIQDSVHPGTILATVVAIDSDGTSPNNLVKYTLGPGHHSYFDMDHDMGAITLKGDLSRDRLPEIHLEVQAYDLGSPQLTVTAMITIYIDRTTKLPPEMGLAFADNSYTVEIEENALGNAIVKSIPVINQHLPLNIANTSSAFHCEIERGNHLDHFSIRVSNNGCELRAKGQKLDYETGPQYQLLIALKSSTASIDSSRSVTEIKVRVKDVNDNRPLFVFHSPASKLIGDRYVTSLSRDAAALTPFTKITAVDNDSGFYGHIQYSITRATDPGGYFIIDPHTGLVSNSRTFDNADYNGTFFGLTVTARDNPTSRFDSLNSTTTLSVNLVSDEHRLVLVILDVSPEKVAEQRNRLIEILQDDFNLVVHVEKIESRKYLNNSRFMVDGTGTDVWFNVIDPHTLKIISVTDGQLFRFFLNKPQQRSLMYSMSTALKMDVEEVRVALNVEQNHSVTPSARRRDVDDVDGFQAGLIALSGVVAILGLVGVIYLCFIWSRFTTYRDRIQRISMASRYEPFLVEPNIKPYETQVLQMTVQTDDSGSSSLEETGSAYDFKGILDNVSYITRDGASTMVLGREEFYAENDSLEGNEEILIPASKRIMAGRSTMSPVHNPVYHSSDENGNSPVDDTRTLRPTTRILVH